MKSPAGMNLIRCRIEFMSCHKALTASLVTFYKSQSVAAARHFTRDTVSKTTRATQFLKQKGAQFTVHTYAYDPDADRIGLQAAEALGERPERVLKTLMALVDGKPVCVVLPSDREVSMKKLASTFDGKAAQMMKPADAERATGFVVGGISPFGQKKLVPTAVEETSLQHELVYLNGGQRGLQVRINPSDLVRLLDARVAGLVSD